MQITWLTEQVGYIRAVVNSGVIRAAGNQVIVIDTGIDESAARKINTCVTSLGLSICAVVNTHAHADHVGGNSALKNITNAEIHAPELEKPLCEAPIYEPIYLSAGAYPVKELQQKFFQALPSKIDVTIRQARHHHMVAGLSLEMIPLPGHAIGQMGIGFDGVLFVADALFSTDVFDKHGIPFFMDSIRQRETLQYIEKSAFSWFVASHAEATQDVLPMVMRYKTFLMTLESHLLGQLQSRRSESDLMRSVCNLLGIKLSNLPQYALTRTPIVAMLNGLLEKGLITYTFDQNILWWHAK